MVARFTHKKGVGYEKAFSPIPRYAYIKVFISISSKMKWQIHSMDLKMAFLNGLI